MASPLAHHGLLFLFSLLTLLLSVVSASSNKPNIVVILTDDQDLHLNSLERMDNLQKLLVQEGTYFEKHYGHVSQCCPARATLWTGKHAHNTNVTTVESNLPGGAWAQIQRLGWYKKWLPVWMQQAGYETYYSGKVYNDYTNGAYCKPVCLEGLSKADIMVDPSTYRYYNSSFAHYDGKDWSLHKNVTGYSTDQIADNVADFIEESVKKGKPFFAVAAPVAPHVPTIPKIEYNDLYQGVTIPRSPNWNPANRSGVATVWGLEPLKEPDIEELDEWYRRRLRCLKSVDDLVATLVQKLDDEGVLDNTYIFYSTDNGFHMGNHRLQGGKQMCFEEDINLPFIVRGPGVGKNKTSPLVTGHIDLAPTILNLAGPVAPDIVLEGIEWDGTPISFPLETEADLQRNMADRGDATHVEYWGPFVQEGIRGGYGVIGKDPMKHFNTYKSLRIQGTGYNLMYSVWCQDSAHELYDMSWDQYQMSNLHPDAPSEKNETNLYHRGQDIVLGRPTLAVIHRLDALVLVLKTCVGIECRFPWQQLHPEGGVFNLMDALNAKYDAYYANSYAVAQVGWIQCYKGDRPHMSSTLYSIANEQPAWLNHTVVSMVRRNDGGRLSVGGMHWAGFALAWAAYLAFVS